MSDESLIYRLRKRAEIRRNIKTRKSVQEGKPDKIANLLEEAADEIAHLEGVMAAKSSLIEHKNRLIDKILENSKKLLESFYVKNRLYRVYSRNLKFAIYDGDGGFIGIRRKFNTRFLDTEVLRELGGTLTVKEDMKIDAPIENISNNFDLFKWLDSLGLQ